MPFCSQQCSYCKYYTRIASKIPDSCLDYLERQFKDVSEIFGNEPIKAINFGGGTPNILSPKQLERILNMIPKYWNLKISDENEMGFEFIPYHLSQDHISVLRNSYINRLSLGVQSFNRDVIRAEKRLYSSKERVGDIYHAVKTFAKIVNIDLMAGLRNQTTNILLEDVETSLKVGFESVTVYGMEKIMGRPHRKIDISKIKPMLLGMYNKYINYPGYRYIGTTENNYMYCNRFYKNVNNFKFFYNSAPIDYNSTLGFCIDDDKSWRATASYSFFIPANMAYQKINRNTTVFYSLDSKMNPRKHWKNALLVRKNHDQKE